MKLFRNFLKIQFTIHILIQIFSTLQMGIFFSFLGPDRLELIIYDITEKKIDNPHSRLLSCFSL